MKAQTGHLRICERGHKYYKSSDCPTCPTCENERKPSGGFLSGLSAPARRALEHEGIRTLEELASFSKKELLELHGFGPSSIPKLEAELARAGLRFKKTT